MKQIVLLCIGLVFIGCKTQTVLIENECKITAVPSEVIQGQYIHFIEKSDFYKNEFANFSKIKNGVLLYRWEENVGSSRFIIIDLDKGFNALRKNEKNNEEIVFSVEEKKRLKFIQEVLEKGNYYQSCSRNDGHTNVYVMIVRHNDEMKVQYFSPSNNFYKVQSADTNINLTKKMFEIINTHFYR
ncbi:hypothetical protein [Flavobacterium hungaricum]|uniref:Lipoprotein n=1 Tax=Flavobacterium hungaricum TaxID=2082725 RepID=A0ABR9TIT7_9FLAO|nr:hypothetical protein [Flavobacterium hungaricum]MBE8725267.1 hypothetical protein [Flavobacterium hungaricum]